MLLCDIVREELKTHHMQIENWPIPSDVVKYVQYDQCPIRPYKLEIKILDDSYRTRMYKRLQESEREVKEMNFN